MVNQKNKPGAIPARAIPLSVPYLGGNELKYLTDCVETNWVSSVGAYVNRFENEVSRRIGLGRAVATVNGTAALHVALRVAGVEADDEVLVSTLSFIAPANAVRYVGAWPVFVDAEPRHWQMDMEKAADFIENNCRFSKGRLIDKATGRRLRAILPVHILGHPVDMDPLLELADKYGLVIVEDATESLGAKYKGRPVGVDGAVACFSFNGNKIITTGGGGMLLTDDDRLADKAAYLTTQAKDDPLEYVHGQVGYNYRLTNIQAAIGCAQLAQLDEFIAAKRRIAATYREAFSDQPGLSFMAESKDAFSTHWLSTVVIDQTEFGLGSREVIRLLAARSIQARPLWQPLHLSPAHPGARATDCSVAEDLNRKAVSLPCSVNLSPGDQSRVIQTLFSLSGPQGRR